MVILASLITHIHITKLVNRGHVISAIPMYLMDAVLYSGDDYYHIELVRRRLDLISDWVQANDVIVLRNTVAEDKMQLYFKSKHTLLSIIKNADGDRTLVKLLDPITDILERVEYLRDAESLATKLDKLSSIVREYHHRIWL